MTDISLNKAKATTNAPNNWIQKYGLYCQKQEKNGFLWYAMMLATIPAVVMPLGIYLMQEANYVLMYITIAMFLFLTNVCIHIAHWKPKITISVFIITLLVHLAFLVAHLGLGI
ncbi:MAG: hypothetical protein ACPGXL_03980 [Chitinophagales bacterium]